MINQEIIRWGFIGCGSVTEIKSGPAYQKTKGFVVHGVTRRNATKGKDYANRHGIEKFYTNAHDLITSNEIDAVYIATPPDSHKYYGLLVADAGKPCCIEKPLAPNYHESNEIYKAFKEKELPLFVAYYRRSLPRFMQVKSWLSDKLIGDIRHVRWHLSKPASQLDLSGEYNWRTDSKIAPGGYFDDLASHGIDLIIYLLGNITNATGISTNQQGLYSSMDAVTGSWIHENGVTGTGSWNFGCNTRQDKVEIYGSKGKVEFSVFDEETVNLWDNDKKTEIFIENPKNIQLPHVMNIREHLLDNSKHPSTGFTATHTSWVMDQILSGSVKF